MKVAAVISGWFLCIFSALALGGAQGHPWFSSGALWLAVLLAVVLLCLSLAQSFFLGMIAILFSGFFLQRILVIYVWPEELDYQLYLYITREDITAALSFALACAVSIGMGYCFAKTFQPRRSTRTAMVVTEQVRILGERIPFETLFRCYAAFAIPLSCAQLLLLFGLSLGVAGLLFDAKYAIVYRLSFLASSLSVIAFIPLIIPGATPKAKRMAISILILQLIFGLGITSKGALLIPVLVLLVCVYFTGRKIHPRYWAYFGVLFLVVVALYVPAVVTLRGALLEGKNWGDAILSVGDAPFTLFSEALLRFSGRLGGLDSLVGFMNVGRGAFPYYVGFWGDMTRVLNSFVPGEIIPATDWISSAYAISFLLRGLPPPTAEALAAHGDNFGLIGMAYVYFGWVGGVVFMFVWAAITTWVMAAKINRIYKLLYFYMFVVVLFSGGVLDTPVSRFYESLISLGIAYILYRWFYQIAPVCVGKRLERSSTTMKSEGYQPTLAK